MRILLDHCVSIEAKSLLTAAQVSHASELGWSTLSNGSLLTAANAEFDLLVTVDKNMRFQSSLRGLQLIVAVLDVRSNLPEELARVMATRQGTIGDLQPGTFNVITGF